MVRVDVTYRTGKDEHSHPASVSSQELNQVLQSVFVETSSMFPIAFNRSGRDVQAFSPEEREFLSFHTARALTRATPLEEVMFFWVHPRDMNIREITSGSMYVQKENLHLVVANFRQPTVSQGDIDRAKGDPLEVLGESLYYLAPGSGGRIAAESFWNKWFSEPRQHLIIPLKAEPLPVADKENRILSIPKVRQESSPSLREKLAELQLLRTEGLISDEEYQTKRQELIERF